MNNYFFSLIYRTVLVNTKAVFSLKLPITCQKFQLSRYSNTIVYYDAIHEIILFEGSDFLEINFSEMKREILSFCDYAVKLLDPSLPL